MDALEAIKLAVEDHMGYVKQKGVSPDWEFVTALREAEKIIHQQREQKEAALPSDSKVEQP
jgi:hypothetical protein